MGRTVIVAYRPKPGFAEELLALCREHVPILRELGLATDQPAVIMQAADGTVLEVFEWASAQAIEAAHGEAAVQQLWERFAAVCDFVPVGQVPEAASLFSEFEALGMA